MLRTRVSAVAALAVIAIVAPAATAQNPVVVTFNGANGANDLNLFVINDQNLVQPPPPTSGANSVFNWGAGNGISDNAGAAGGGLMSPAPVIDATAAYAGPGGSASPTTWNLNTGASVSTMVQVQALPGNRFLQLGFLNQLNNALNGNAAQTNAAFVSVRLYPNERLEMQTKSVNGGTVGADFTAGGTNLTLNNWYRIGLDVKETSATNFSATVHLDDYGPTGTALVGNLFTGTLTATVTGFEVSNGGLLGADGLGIAAFRQVDSPAFFDSFSVIVLVPEPTCLLAVAGCAGGLRLLWRRRRFRNSAQDSASVMSRL